MNDSSGKSLIATLLEGQTPQVMLVDQRMSDFAASYSNEELAAVSTFALRRFGQTRGEVKAESSKKAAPARCTDRRFIEIPSR